MTNDGPPAHGSRVTSPRRALAEAGISLNIPMQSFGASARTVAQDPICEGWILKKRRKKLQGYARRYFVLRSSGLLSYSFEPGGAVRDQILLQNAAISSTPGRRDIHIDSPRVTFHLKCLTTEDFQKWMASLRTFTVTNIESAAPTIGRRSLARNAGYLAAMHHAVALLEEMGKTIDDLSYAVQSMDDDRKSMSAQSDEKPQTSNGKGREHKEGHSLLSLFKKGGSSPAQSPNRPSFTRDPPSGSSVTRRHEYLLSLTTTLREQHRNLHNTVVNSTALHSHPRSPIQRTIDEECATPTNSSPLQQWSSADRLRSSKSSFGTDGSSVWFDASEGEDLGAEEFVLDEGVELGEDSSASEMRETETESSADRTEDSEAEVEEELDETPDEPRPSHELLVNRRTRLPSGPPEGEGSLFAILKKNVGQDLSNVSFPVTFNEPLTLLQRHAEEMEYFDLLDKAAAASDWVQRIAYIAAFAISGYACTKYRSGRKGFTPLLGETFEDVRMRFIAEKVVHKPLVIAYHASGSGWELNATSSGKTKFWGKSFEIIPTGVSSVKIGEDTFEWNKPSSFTRNLMMGTKYLEHCGEMTVRNVRTDEQCVVDFKETGYWASSPNVVEGKIIAADGGIVSRLEGKWDESVAQKLDANHLRILWRISPFPRDAAEFYGFTFFAITLNEITPDIAGKLPPTDSRFRPDVRALEEGDVATAESEKERLEQMQRERRQAGRDVKPRWFKKVNGTDQWVYAGGYWEARRSGWKNVELQKLF